MKVAVSIPDDVFEAAENASRRLGVSRSRFYAEAVREYAKDQSGVEITWRLNQVHAPDVGETEPEVLDASLEVLRRERW